MNLRERIESHARNARRRLAHISGSRALTYGDLLRRLDAVAAHLYETLGSGRSPIAVYGHKEPEMLAAFLGCIKAGHPYVPIDISAPSQRIERILDIAHIPLTLTPEIVAALPEAGAPVAGRALAADDPYYIMFTSGSTGEPKGVVITLGNLTSFVEWMLAEHSFRTQAETFLNQAPFSFDLSVMDLYLSLATGGTLFSISAEEIANPRKLYEAFARGNLSVWVSTPSFAQMCLVEKTFNQNMLPQLRKFLFCGETLSPSVAARLLERFPQAEIWNTYGPTEATVATTSVRVTRETIDRYSPLPVGYPKPDSRITLLDESGQEAERGEIVIAGPNVSPGYLGRSDLTAHSFFKYGDRQAYRTGDAGHYQDGLLFFEGRMDNQIKLHGYRIELGDVEANLCALDNVRDAVVLPLRKNDQNDSLAAIVILAARSSPDDFVLGNQLRAELAKRLPAYMLPRKFCFVETFPMTANGKADRRKLAEFIQGA